MRRRWSIGGLMVAIALIGVFLGLTLVQARQAQRAALVERERALAAEAFARLAVAQSALATKASPESDPGPADFEAIRTENQALRERVRQLEEALKGLPRDRKEPSPSKPASAPSPSPSPSP